MVLRVRASDFQLLATQVLRRLYPALIAVELFHDGGEDAISLPVEGAGRSPTLLCSLTPTLSKIREDCRRLQSRGVRPAFVLFATPKPVTRLEVDRWKARIDEEFGLALEVLSQSGLLTELERPENHWICAEYLDVVFPPPFAPATARKTVTVPHLLPFLADRDEQDAELASILSRFHREPTRPIVCIVHGSALESHDTFVERLHTVSLPRLLGLNPRTRIVTRYCVASPPPTHSPGVFAKHLKDNLGKIIVHRDRANTEDIHRFLAQIAGPILIDSHLLSSDWRDRGGNILEHHVAFWNRWPDLRPRQLLLILLSVKYQDKLTYFARLRANLLNTRIRKALRTCDFSKYRRVKCSVLPELTAIARRDAENWARGQDVARFCKPHDLVAEIGGVFERWEAEHSTDGIPMDRLAPKLEALLHKRTSF